MITDIWFKHVFWKDDWKWHETWHNPLSLIFVQGSLAYVPQQAWIQNRTMRDNIVFGKPFIKEKYENVLSACALRQDLTILSDGDMTEIGEKVRRKNTMLCNCMSGDVDLPVCVMFKLFQTIQTQK